jgi:glycosyltransferase involved in cell wall biosynthesis
MTSFMLFDLATGGHHATYIRYLVRYWLEQELLGKLYLVVSPEFLEKHADTVELVRDRENLQFVPVMAAEIREINVQKYRINRFFKEWYLSANYARKLKVRHCLFMYFDYLQLPIALRLKFPCSFSGIYFRPTLHYKNLNNYAPSKSERLREWRKKTLLHLVLQNRQLKALFCLDPLAIEQINLLSDRVQIIYLPDPVEIHQFDRLKIVNLKSKLEIDPERQIFLFFGRLGYRKGIYQLIAAIKLLSSDLCQQICLLIAGSIPLAEKLTIETLLQEVSQSLPIQIIICNEFIPEAEVHLYFQMADAIAAPYQQHIGMSGIMLLAAAAQKPVLSSDYGLMGQLVVANQLGITVNATSPLAIAEAIPQLINKGDRSICDLNKMKVFAEKHSWHQFAATLINNIR